MDSVGKMARGAERGVLMLGLIVLQHRADVSASFVGRHERVER